MQLLCTNGGNGIVMCAMWVSLFVSVSVLFVCHCRRLSPKNLLSWPTSGNARGQSACGGRLRQTLVWPLRWVGARALPRSRPSGFFAGKAGGDTFTNPTLRRLVRAARCRLGAVAGGASRAICVPRQSVPSCRRARPCGLAPRHGLHPPSAAPSPPPSLRSLRRLRCPPCGSWARVQIRPYATWSTPQNENTPYFQKARRWMQPPATRYTFGQNGMVEARRKSAGGGAAAADGERSPRRGARPGARPSRVGAGRRSPGMRRQPLPQADTKRMTTRRGHVAWQRELDVFTRQKNARPRLREGGRPT